MEKIIFNAPDTEESIEFFCLEQTQINNQNYLLVTEDEEGDSEAYILKETSSTLHRQDRPQTFCASTLPESHPGAA